MAEKITLSKADRQKVWWRSQFLQGSWNYERMQNLGWAYALIPAIKKLYTSKEDRAAALERHLEFFNTHPYVAAPIIGVTLALEEEKANGTEIEDTAIQGVKIGMMGPLAGIGDPVFWFTVRPILGALGASLASTGNIVGPLIFFFGWNAIRMAFLWYTQEFGYKAGSEITKDMSGGILQDIT
ncbi:PTS system mannose/fructose/sorbose family transporter subunit IID, partial [Streptococcus suis]